MPETYLSDRQLAARYSVHHLTLSAYCPVSPSRQGELIRGMA